MADKKPAPKKVPPTPKKVPPKKAPPKPRLKDNLTGTFKSGTPASARDLDRRAKAKAEAQEGEQSLPPQSGQLQNGMPVYQEAGRVTESPATSGAGSSKDVCAPAASSSVSVADLIKARRDMHPDVTFSPGTVKCLVAGYTPTDEQQAILEAAVVPGLEVLVVGAGAGTGKTSVLRMLEEVLPGSGQYTAFNKALVTESKTKFKRTPCSTTHSLAFQGVGRMYAHRLGGPRVRSDQVARILGLEGISITIPDPDGKLADDGVTPLPKVKNLSASFLATLVRKAIEKYCQGAEQFITRRHFRKVPGIDAVGPDGVRDDSNNRMLAEHLLPFAEAAWQDIASVDGKLPFTHDNYVKIWQLGEGVNAPVIPTSYILLDEHQDTAEVFLDVLKRQSCLLILVGDDNQRIYEWRGAVNAGDAFPNASRRLLSQSFRFGQAIADVANSILDTLDESTDLVMKGLESIPSIVITSPGSWTDGYDAVLCRTNAMAVGVVIQSVDSGKRPHLVGGGADVVAFVKAARDLQEGRTTGHMDLCCFDSWTEVQTYVKDEGGEGEDLKLLVKLIDDFGAGPILTALENMPSEADADLVVSTAHKSKGKEWSRVKLAPDFPPANSMSDSDRRLLYVAATRAKHVLDISECPPFIRVKDKVTGQDMPPLRITLTKPMPTREELDKYLVEEKAKRLEGLAKVPVIEDRPATPFTPPSASSPMSPAAGRQDPFSWTSLGGGEWGVRGPSGAANTTVTVVKKSREVSQVMLGDVVSEDRWGSTYRVRR